MQINTKHTHWTILIPPLSFIYSWLQLWEHDSIEQLPHLIILLFDLSKPHLQLLTLLAFLPELHLLLFNFTLHLLLLWLYFLFWYASVQRGDSWTNCSRWCLLLLSFVVRNVGLLFRRRIKIKTESLYRGCRGTKIVTCDSFDRRILDVTMAIWGAKVESTGTALDSIFIRFTCGSRKHSFNLFGRWEDISEP